VWLVEDESLVREGLKALLALSPRIVLTGESPDARSRSSG
jgi:DNA-binding NarL/FixJ family response regulator